MKSGHAQWQRLTEAPVGRTLATFALPMLAGNVLQSLNASVNSMWVGRFLGEAALTATSNANGILFLLLSAVFGFSMAASVLLGQHVGAGRVEDAKRVVGTGASFFLAYSLIIAALGVILAPHLLDWMNTPAESRADAAAYLRVIFLALPAMNFMTFVMATLRSSGDTKTPAMFLALAVLLDIALNPLFIFGVGPLPRLGVAGSATATLWSQYLALGLLLRHLYRTRHPLRIAADETRYLRPDRGTLGILFVRGIPMGLQMLVMSSSFLAMISLVNSFGAATTAALAANNQVWTYIQMPAMAIGAACSSMASINIGAGLWDRVHRIARAGVLINFAMTGTLVAINYLLNRPLMGLFLPATGGAIEHAVHLNHIAGWSFVFFGVTFVLLGVVRASGAVMWPLLILLISLWGVRFGFALSLMQKLGEDAIWWAFPLGTLASMLLAMAYYRSGRWRHTKLVRVSEAAQRHPAAPEDRTGRDA